ncbi:MAG: FtsX-like permease family protein [Candidatus Synoicihabitans palmerolidicus]|nr:FtsX-like permease family protein [Candidatus Synoicihabitans palmerolidicus]
MAQRTSEFGIRLALGAQTGSIIQLVLKAGVRLALIGAVLGLIGAFGLSRLLSSVLPSMELNSGSVIAIVTGGLIAVAVIACYLPACRAARISPVEALRSE